MESAPEGFHGTARFELLDRLGQGGMGVVFAAFDRERNLRVALKTLLTLTPDSLLRFKEEFRALQDLQHPNLVRLDELFEADGAWFFTMELVEGVDFLRYVRSAAGTGAAPATRTVVDPPTSAVTDPTLSVEHLRRAQSGAPLSPAADVAVGGSFDEQRLRHALRQLASGLHALHEAGKVHRDVKPGNILIGRDDRAVLLDFGLVTDASAHQREGRAVGTVAYMAPEQLGGEAVGPAADWYAVGVTLYQALTGRPPFAGTTDEIASLKLSVEPVPPGDFVAGLPSDLEALCVDLLHRNPARRPAGAEVLHRLGAGPALAAPRPRSAIFVGRDGELAQLREAFVDTMAGRTVAVLVHGESGVGKSALVRRFLERISGPQVVTLAGRCYERESVPYKALDQVMDGLVRHLAALPRAEVATLLPEPIALVGEAFPALRKVPVIDEASARIAEVRSADRFHRRALMFTALRELWLRLGCRRPLVVSVDDLQWADADSLALLSHLMDGAGAPPFLLCATVRTSAEPSAHPLAILRDRLGDDVRDLRVGRLPAATARELVERLLEGAGGGTAGIDADRVVAEAGGHPMFIEALVRHRMRRPGAADPLRLDDALVARTGELEPAAALLLDLVCVAGGPIAQDAWSQAAGLSFADAAPVVAALRAAHLVRTHGVRRGDPVEPYHDRVREAAVARIAPELRRSLHLRLAQALEASGDVDPELLAVHFAEGGSPDVAARYAARAADRALAALAFAQAVRLYRRALELDPDGADAPRLRVALGEALASAGRGRDAAEVYLAAAEQVDAPERLELRRRAAEQLLISGRIDEGLGVLRTVLDSVGLKMPETPRRALVSLLMHRALIALRGGLRGRLRDAASVPVEMLTRIDTCFSASMGLAIVDTIRGADFQTRHLHLALRAGEPYRLACALAAEAGFSATKGGPGRARTERLVQAAGALARQVGHPNALGYATFAAGAADYLVGRWRSGLALCDQATAIFRDRCAGVTWWSDTVQYFAAECLAYTGNTAELCLRVPALLADAEARGDLFAATNFQIGLPNLAWLVIDDSAEARRRVTEAMAAWSHQAFHIQHLAEVLALVQADLYDGDGPSAHQRITAAWSAITGAVIFRVQLTRIATYHQRARAAVAAAGASPAGSPARRALIAEARWAARRIARERMPWSDPLAALARAGAAHVEGNVEVARAELAAAVSGFDASDMMVYAAAARYCLGVLDGGTAGAALAARAIATLEAAAVRRPDRMTGMLAPGF